MIVRRMLVLAIVVICIVAIPAGQADAKPKITKACAAALDAADDFRVQTLAYISLQTTFGQEMGAALQLSSFVSALNAATVATNKEAAAIRSITPLVADASDRYHVAAAKCRAGK